MTCLGKAAAEQAVAGQLPAPLPAACPSMAPPVPSLVRAPQQGEPAQAPACPSALPTRTPGSESLPHCTPEPCRSPGCWAATKLPGRGAVSALEEALQRVALSCRERAKNLQCFGFQGAPRSPCAQDGTSDNTEKGAACTEWEDKARGDTRTKRSCPLLHHAIAEHSPLVTGMAAKHKARHCLFISASRAHWAALHCHTGEYHLYKKHFPVIPEKSC